jgi:hypothetical protein
VKIEQTGQADCLIWSGSELIGEIRALRLSVLRLKTGGESVLGSDVPLPLYWQQYADHEHPERNASSAAQVEIGNVSEDRVEVVCRGSTASGAMQSEFRLLFARVPGGRYELTVTARLSVVGEAGWRVTPNPHHGELEFCNMWPVGTFTPDVGRAKRYTVTGVRRGSDIALLRHHHLESADKHNNDLQYGDECAWLLEDENPAVRIESDPTVCAGLCAYMWDMHFAYRVCDGGIARILPRGYTMEARYRVRALPRVEGEQWTLAGRVAVAAGLDAVPVYVRGMHTFGETFASAGQDRTDLWPWTFEIVRGTADDVSGALDRSTGFDDSSSLRIQVDGHGAARWVATTLGPAFGEPPFSSGRRYRLTAFVRSTGGSARIALAIHRTDAPGLYDPGSYEEYGVPVSGKQGNAWNGCMVETPTIAPAPDRIHLRLSHEGEGTSWFDNVLFEEYD